MTGQINIYINHKTVPRGSFCFVLQYSTIEHVPKYIINDALIMFTSISIILDEKKLFTINLFI